jgi:hypothetical protein
MTRLKHISWIFQEYKAVIAREEMTMKKKFLLCLIVFCLPLAAMAQDYPKAEIFGGISILSGSLAIGDYNEIASRLGTDSGGIPPGWDLEDNLLRRNDREQFYGFQANVAGNFREKFGIVADFGYQYNDLNGQRLAVYEYLFGPRFSIRADRATVFAHTLFGGNGHHSGGSKYLIDVNAGNRLAIRVVQFDWIPNRMGGEWSTGEIRLGFGFVFKAGN